MCGAVTYTAEVHGQISACHCGMCRRWGSGPYLAIGADRVEWSGADDITTFTSSAWAERGFCAKCGSNLFYRITAEGKMQGFTSLAFGTLDDPSGVELTREWFIDKKPDAYTLAGERETITEAEVMAMFGGG